MKKFLFFGLASLILLSSCNFGKVQTPQPTPTQTNTPTKIPTSTSIPATATLVPTATYTPTPIPMEQQRIRKIMEDYGHVDEKYLSAKYWQKMADDIAKYGPAKRILTLEFHGDNYSMYDGSYSMMPESFYKQMEYLMQNNYHFVTGPETLGFLEGWLQLPARSIILTTDSSGGSMNSMPRIIADFQKLEAKYGYTPHMQSYIWTYAMRPENTIRCKNDICWKDFQDYLQTGYFTFGSHSERHGDFGKFTREETEWDLTTNVNLIYEKMGLHVYSLTWPLEVCSPYEDIVRKAGIKFAFGGCTRDMDRMYTYANDNLPLCLPRMFPPNPDGYSGRPTGQTLEQMLDKAMNKYLPLKIK